MSATVKYPCAMGAPKGDSRRARSRSTWIHWWSPVASAKRTMSSNAIVRQSDLPISLPARASRPAIPSITVLFAMAAAISRCRCARTDHQGLRGAPERPVEIGESAVRESDSVGVRFRGDLPPEPLTARFAAEMHGEIRVEEAPFVRVDRRADAALGVGEDEHSFALRCRLAGNQREERPHPGVNRTLAPRPARDAHLDRRVVRDVVAEEREAEGRQRAGGRQLWRRGRLRQMKPLPAQAQSQRPRHLDAAGRERGTDPLRLPTGPNDLGRQLERGDRDWPQELDGDARQPEFARIGTCALDGTGEESPGW